MAKEIKFTIEARALLKEGVDQLADARGMIVSESVYVLISISILF